MGAESILCLAMNIYHEARGESIEGQIAVAVVTMNRVKESKWPNTPCEVVWQNKQFSWTKDGKSDRMPDRDARRQAFEIATGIYIAYEGGHDYTLEYGFGVDAGAHDKHEGVYDYILYDHIINLMDNAVYYHADYADPYWSKEFQYIASIDKHRFYREWR